MTTRAPEDRVGTTLAGKYELVRLLGAGGSGAVYEASHRRTGARCAIKLLHPSADRAQADRMLREARALAKLEHDHIVRLVDLDEDGDGELYLVEELLRGRTLRALLDEELLLSPQRALELLVPVLRALGYAHARGIVHRDLKPENIFLCEDEAGRVTPKLLDFGLVREPASASGPTRPGTLIGTPRYMSPEQAWGREDLDGRSDLWSLGVVLYECLSGVGPFEGENDRAVLASIVATDPPHLRSTGVAVDEELADAVMLGLTRAPEARIPSALAWEAALANVATLAAEPWHAALFPGRLVPGHPGSAPAPAPTATERTPAAPAALPPPAERSPWRLLLTALAAAAVLALAWMALRPGPSASGATAQPLDSLAATAGTDPRPTGPQPTDTVATAAPISADSRQSSEARGSTGTDSTGTDSTGTDSTGTDSTDTDPTGTDSTGTDPTGTDPTNSQATGREAGGAPTESGRRRRRSSGRTDAERPVDVRAQEPVRSAGPNAAPLVDEI